MNVSAGAMLLANEPARFLAREDYGDSMVSKLYESVRKPTEDASTSKFLKVYLVMIILIGITAGLSWILAGNPLINALQVTISIFVISCPCAIGVALPLVERRISTVMARHGVFIQQARFWQNMLRLKHIILDKTGTLTLEHPVLSNSGDLEVLSRLQKSALDLLTADSIHPLDRTLQQQLATKANISQRDETESEMTPGIGSALTFQGHLWTLGKVGWLGKDNFLTEDTTSLSCEFGCDGKSIVVFEFEESLRPDAVVATDQLKTRGLDLHILSGDSQSRILEFARELGIPPANAHGELSPEQKEEETSLLQPGLYLGDGMNDASAFASSIITGTPVTDRSMLDRRASFIFTCQSLSFLPKLFDAAKWTSTTTRLIIAFTLCYNAVAITTCCLGKMTPLLAAILMPISSIISVGISLRPINRRSKPTKI
jgi:Cu2+-exporting ATPase